MAPTTSGCVPFTGGHGRHQRRPHSRGGQHVHAIPRHLQADQGKTAPSPCVFPLPSRLRQRLCLAGRPQATKGKASLETSVFYLLGIASFYLAEALGANGIISAWSERPTICSMTHTTFKKSLSRSVRLIAGPTKERTRRWSGQGVGRFFSAATHTSTAGPASACPDTKEMTWRWY